MSVQSGDEATRVRAHLGDRIADLERDLAAIRARLESTEQERDRLREAFAETSRLDMSAMEVSAERLKQNETLRARLESAEKAQAKLQAFKDFCHSYLDDHGVPHNPPSTHSAEGCRIGGRLDWVFADLTTARARLESAVGALRRLANPDASMHDVGHMAESARAALGAAGEGSEG